MMLSSSQWNLWLTLLKKCKALKNNPEQEIESIDFTDTTELSISSKTAEKMKDKGVGDTEAFNKVVGEIKAIKNVNTSIKKLRIFLQRRVKLLSL